MKNDEITDILALYTEYMEAYGYDTDTPGFTRSRRFWIKFLKKLKYIKKPKKRKGGGGDNGGSPIYH